MSLETYLAPNPWELDEQVRDRLVPMPANGLKEATGACIDARAGHPDCPVLGTDNARHVVRYRGSWHGAWTDLKTTFAADDPDRFEEFMDLDSRVRYKIEEEIKDGVSDIGPIQTVHEGCADMGATNDTVRHASVFHRPHFRLARKILDELGEKEYLHACQGSNRLTNSSLLHAHDEAALRHHRRRRTPVATLRDSEGPREALYINRTGMLLPPMEYNEDGTPRYHLVYDSDAALVIPTLAEVARAALSKKIRERTLDVVSANHLAVLATRTIKLPYDRVRVLE